MEKWHVLGTFYMIGMHWKSAWVDEKRAQKARFESGNVLQLHVLSMF